MGSEGLEVGFNFYVLVAAYFFALNFNQVCLSCLNILGESTLFVLLSLATQLLILVGVLWPTTQDPTSEAWVACLMLSNFLVGCIGLYSLLRLQKRKAGTRS